jgi:hypothetical protein
LYRTSPVRIKFEEDDLLARTFSSVVLPDPEPPIIAIKDPEGKSKEVESSRGLVVLSCNFSSESAGSLAFHPKSDLEDDLCLAETERSRTLTDTGVIFCSESLLSCNSVIWASSSESGVNKLEALLALRLVPAGSIAGNEVYAI